MATTTPNNGFYWTSDIPSLGVVRQYNPITQETRDRSATDNSGNVIAVRNVSGLPLDISVGDIDPVSEGRIFSLRPLRAGATSRQGKVFFVLPGFGVNYGSATEAVNKFQVEIPGGDDNPGGGDDLGISR